MNLRWGKVVWATPYAFNFPASHFILSIHVENFLHSTANLFELWAPKIPDTIHLGTKIGTANAMWWWESEECWNMKLRPSLWCFVFGSDELKMNVILRKKKKLWSLLHTHGIRCALVWSPKDTFHNLKLKSRKEIFFFVFGHRNWGGNEIKYDMGWLGKVRQSGHAA